MKLDILQQDREELRKLLTKKKRLSGKGYECTYCHSVLTRGQS